MRADESGQVSSATISTSSPERTISYELIATAATALDIVAPEL